MKWPQMGVMIKSALRAMSYLLLTVGQWFSSLAVMHDVANLAMEIFPIQKSAQNAELKFRKPPSYFIRTTCINANKNLSLFQCYIVTYDVYRNAFSSYLTLAWEDM